MRDAAVRLARRDAPGDLADADRVRRSSPGSTASGPPDGLITVLPFEPERLGEDQLLVAELRVQLGDVDVAVVTPAAIARPRSSTPTS